MSGEILIPAAFDPGETLDCGQAFRWRKLPEEDGFSFWEGAAGSRFLRLRREGNFLRLFCSQQEFDAFWSGYFDLAENYEEKRSRLSSFCPALAEAAAFAPGIHILRQEPWEALCSFLISQNNNIPRIKGIIDRLCTGFGAPIPGTGWHGFPSPETLAALTVEELAPLRAGFRAKYLIDAARKIVSGEVDLEKTACSPAEFGRSELQKILGVGPKVAECTLLYGFHKTECFPVDVWIRRAMAALLPGRSPEEFGENAGLAQQYIFHYSRMHPELFRESSNQQLERP